METEPGAPPPDYKTRNPQNLPNRDPTPPAKAFTKGAPNAHRPDQARRPLPPTPLATVARSDLPSRGQTEIGGQIQIHLESLFKESSPKSSTPTQSTTSRLLAQPAGIRKPLIATTIRHAFTTPTYRKHLIIPRKLSSAQHLTLNGNSLSQRTEQARIDFTLPSVARRIIAAGDFKGRTNETLVRWLEAEKKWPHGCSNGATHHYSK